MDKEYYRLSTAKRYLELPLKSDSFNDIVSLAANICETPVAIISIIDDIQEHFLATLGTDRISQKLESRFCLKSILQDQVLTIPNLTKHKKFTTTDLAIGSPDILFYAGVTLTSPAGFSIGRLYVLDLKPKQLTKSQEYCLQTLAMQSINRLEQLLTVQKLQEHLKDDELFQKTKLEILLHSTNINLRVYR